MVGRDGLVRALDDHARGERLNALHGRGNVVDEPEVGRGRRVVEVVERAEDEFRRLPFGARLRLDEERHRGVGTAFEFDLGDLVCGRVGRILVIPHRDRRDGDVPRGLELDLALVGRPDVERALFHGRRGDREPRAHAAAGDRRVLVHRAPVVRALVVRGEADGLDVDSALLEGIVGDRGAADVGDRAGDPRVVGREEPAAVVDLVVVRVVANHLPVRVERVEHVRTVGDRVASGSRHRREANRHREVARLRGVLEDERSREVALLLHRHETRVGLLAGDVDADLHRVQGLGDVLGNEAVVVEPPEAHRGPAGELARHKADFEVDVDARAERVVGNRPCAAVNAVFVARDDVVDVAFGGIGEKSREQCERGCECEGRQFLFHGLFTLLFRSFLFGLDCVVFLHDAVADERLRLYAVLLKCLLRGGHLRLRRLELLGVLALLLRLLERRLRLAEQTGDPLLLLPEGVELLEVRRVVHARIARVVGIGGLLRLRAPAGAQAHDDRRRDGQERDAKRYGQKPFRRPRLCCVLNRHSSCPPAAAPRRSGAGACLSSRRIRRGNSRSCPTSASSRRCSRPTAANTGRTPQPSKALPR